MNQDNQVFQEVQEMKVLVFQVSLDPEGFQDQKVHQGLWDHKDLQVKQEILVLQEPLLTVLMVPASQDHLDHLDHLVPLEEMEAAPDQRMWASTSQSIFRVVESDSTWLDLLDLQVLQGPLVHLTV